MSSLSSEAAVQAPPPPKEATALVTTDGAGSSTSKSPSNRFAFTLEKPEDRGEWSSRFAFYMATIGAAVGFGTYRYRI